ncbi:MAG: biopolymer transporter [Crocosphaera sp.]|nr:biopolymer transporter [Crocosphaera sp.]
MVKLHLKWVEGYVKLFTTSILISLVSCANSGFITPPIQPLGNSLNTRSSEQHPRFSYEGRYLVFASDRQGKRSVWLYDQFNGRLLPLPGLNQPGSRQDQPDISADGRYIVYVSEQEGKQDIFVYDRQTSRADNITKNILGELRHPTISGNGRLVAFESNRSGQWDIIIYDRGLNAPLSLPSQSNLETQN